MSLHNNGLSFATLRSANLERLPRFLNKHGEKAHSENDGSDWNPAEWLQAVTGELGEYANFAKKFKRGDITEAEFQAEASKELADVAIYLDILAFQLGIDLGQAVQSKWNETSAKLGIPMRIGPDDDWHFTENGITRINS